MPRGELLCAQIAELAGLAPEALEERTVAASMS
jgi:hypothetical protein